MDRYRHSHPHLDMCPDQGHHPGDLFVGERPRRADVLEYVLVVRLAPRHQVFPEGGGSNGGGGGDGENEDEQPNEEQPDEPQPVPGGEEEEPKPPPANDRQEVVQPFRGEGEAVEKEDAIVAVEDPDGGVKPPQRVPLEKALRDFEKQAEQAITREGISPRDRNYFRAYFEAFLREARKRDAPDQPAPKDAAGDGR